MTTYDQLWGSLEPIGRDSATGGYERFAYAGADLAAREWLVAAAQERGLDVHTDRNGNLWAWATPPGPDALVVGSHLDSVPQGGAYDGPLGVISALAALDALRERALTLKRPLAVVVFADEEGARFGTACVGSRLLTGALDPDTARGLRDRDGTTMAEAMRAAGHDPTHLGRDLETLRGIGAFVELHVEQGRALVALDAPVGVATRIWPHGRYRFTFTGQANHAGTTRMDDRHDPMLTYAMTALAANKQARLADARATFGKVAVVPNGTNAIPSRVDGWLDARARDDEALELLLDAVRRQAYDRADRDGTTLEVFPESASPAVEFDADLRDRLALLLGAPDGEPAPVLATQAGHDAGILAAAGVPAAMLFVRNPTGVSHSPAEHAERDDCLAGVAALARVIEDLAC
ncbi:MAG TPA: allantoate amidohydrolase [Actinomycetes bacterium]|nr:allantoate amidohydrolase [Actinomycetes bacterium]